jgi:hypothetical protein
MVLVVVGIGFLAVRQLAIPASWDSERWFRRDALEDLKKLPTRFGGNESCAGASCHDDQRPKHHQVNLQTLDNGAHNGLACENCHKPLYEHVQDGRKIGFAGFNQSSELCLRCHAPLVSRPASLSQFREDFIYHELLDVRISTPCRICHDPHEPK